MTDVETRAFYDALASHYDLIFEDWNASMRRQGKAILALLTQYLPDCLGAICVLDATAGIGTQSLPLAMLGCRVVSRDLSPASIPRLLHLLEMAGFDGCQRLDGVFYQPVLVGRRPMGETG